MKTKQEVSNYLFQVYLTFNVGLLFSIFSKGLFSYFAYTIIFEMVSAYKTKCKYDAEIVTKKIILFTVGLGGFFIGRRFIARDKHPYRLKYKECPTYEDIWWGTKVD